MNGPFQGSYVALPTPFRAGAIDYAALLGLVERQIDAGTDGLVVCGTTAEVPALSERERLMSIEFVAGAVRGRVPVIAGIGTNGTARSCELARTAGTLGVQGLLAVVPYYNKPNQRGLCAHFSAIAGVSELPIVLYNSPGRTGADLLPATVAELVESQGNIVAIKEASGSLARIRELIALGTIDVFSGEDHLIADCMQLGGAGVIGVIGNVAPGPVRELTRAAAPGGDTGRAAALVERLAPLTQALFLETNPAPLKAALAALGLCGGELRLPMVSVTEETRKTLAEALRFAGFALEL